jgi:hypothetical protein
MHGVRCPLLARRAVTFGIPLVEIFVTPTRPQRTGVSVSENHLLASVVAHPRSRLTDDAYAAAMNVGRDADLNKLLEVALLEAEAAVVAGGANSEAATR